VLVDAARGGALVAFSTMYIVPVSALTAGSPMDAEVVVAARVVVSALLKPASVAASASNVRRRKTIAPTNAMPRTMKNQVRGERRFS
jgi:hypothetical protein